MSRRSTEPAPQNGAQRVIGTNPDQIATTRPVASREKDEPARPGARGRHETVPRAAGLS
jgi:hypothetical protein